MISVIVPNHDGQEILPDCLDGLARQSLQPLQVIVVDDASTDGSKELLKNRFGWVTLVELDQNLGFAGACCKGLEQADGEWIAVLNSDAVPERDWLFQASLAMGRLPQTGMIASRVTLNEPKGLIDSAGLRITRGGMAFLSGHRDYDRPSSSLPAFQEVAGPAGSAALYSRELIDKVGFFEPTYQAYYEDTDLALRARWSGFRCVLANRARVVHRHSYTMDRVGVNKRYFLHKNRLRTIIRNYPLSLIVRNLHRIVGANLAGMARAVLEGNTSAALKARAHLPRHLSQDIEVRSRIISTAAITSAEFAGWLCADRRPIIEDVP